MKNYLSLVPISAGVHKRQNRMTLLCITIAINYKINDVYYQVGEALKAAGIPQTECHSNLITVKISGTQFEWQRSAFHTIKF